VWEGFNVLGGWYFRGGWFSLTVDLLWGLMRKLEDKPGGEKEGRCSSDAAACLPLQSREFAGKTQRGFSEQTEIPFCKYKALALVWSQEGGGCEDAALGWGMPC